jgi:tRNA pseudouridine38-40 synthase
MQKGIRYLIGKHDFTSFRTIKCQAKSPIRTLDEVTFSTEGEEIVIRVIAKSFLHSQVRIIVGTILKIGDGTLKPQDMDTILKGKNRSLAGPTAPPDGLYLEKVDYPDDVLNNNWPLIYDAELKK